MSVTKDCCNKSNITAVFSAGSFLEIYVVKLSFKIETDFYAVLKTPIM